MARRLVAVIAIATVLAGISSSPAPATFPGANGLIAYDSDNQLVRIDPVDGGTRGPADAAGRPERGRLRPTARSSPSPSTPGTSGR